jgi:2-desacetyl-2-hydroxyethyl bacteriochlorophyllide A dehydrogenase
MRAVVYARFGGPEVLEVREVPRPQARRGEVLVRVRVAALNPKDLLIRKGRMKLLSGTRFPRFIGYDFAGEVVEAPEGAGGLRPGDRVFGMLNGHRGGTCAEYVAVPVNELVRTPGQLGDAEAAALPLVSLTALQALRDVAGLKPGQSVLVIGASGGVGTVAIQLARSLGATVTTVSSSHNLALCRELGAHRALDYAAEAPLRGGTYDVIFDVFGKTRFEDARQALAPHGCFVSTVPSRAIFTAWARTLVGRQRGRLVVVKSRASDLEHLVSLVTGGRLRAVVDRELPLDSIREASAFLETRRARGKVVLRVA